METLLKHRRARNLAAHSWAPLPPAPPPGRLGVYSRNLDSSRAYATDGVTYARLKSIVKAGDAGNLALTLAGFEEMEEKDAELLSVASTRRMALTGLAWRVNSAAEEQEEVPKQTLADEAAAYIKETLKNLDSFEPGLEHLATAIGPNIAVLEVVWQDSELADLVPIESQRLTQQLWQTPDIRVVTDAERTGIPAIVPKFIVHRPGSYSGWVLKRSLSRATALVWLMKHLCLADWATYCELFGMPIRVGRYNKSTTTGERTELADMLENLGTNAWAMISDAATIELVESSQRGIAPFEAMIAFCGRAIAKVWLGATLTSDTTGATGTYAAGAVHEQVRSDLRDDDIRRESRTIRSDLIAPLCAFKFPNQWVDNGRGFPLPTFSRVAPDTIDYLKRAQLIQAASQRIGLPVGREWAYAQLGIPKPDEGDEVLPLVNPNPFAGESLPIVD